jgi:hypothetical protein
MDYSWASLSVKYLLRQETEKSGKPDAAAGSIKKDDIGFKNCYFNKPSNKPALA